MSKSAIKEPVKSVPQKPASKSGDKADLDQKVGVPSSDGQPAKP